MFIKNFSPPVCHSPPSSLHVFHLHFVSSDDDAPASFCRYFGYDIVFPVRLAIQRGRAARIAVFLPGVNRHVTSNKSAADVVRLAGMEVNSSALAASN